MSSCTTRVLNAATQGLQQCEVQPVQQRTHSRTSRHWYTYTTSARAPSRLAALDAAMKPTFTLGIEEEYQTVDPETRDLRSHIHAEIIEKGKLVLQERVKTEMHQSVVEVGTSVCANIKEAREELKSLRRHMIRLARENGLRLAAAATHPFADWRVQELTPGERYKTIVEDMQLVARANLIFGLHVHVGIEDQIGPRHQLQILHNIFVALARR